jgi:rhodanese-related sulfurtransferase
MQNKFNHLPDEALVYPAHGAGSLCGKNMSTDSSSTLGNERMGNWAFKKQTEAEFLENILEDQPIIPSYFGFNVDLNKHGAENVQKSKGAVNLKLFVDKFEEGVAIVDTRDGDIYKNSHFPDSINIMARSDKDDFETWLGVLTEPKEAFYLVVQSVKEIDYVLERTAKIGYEKQIKAIVTLSDKGAVSSDKLDLKHFKKNPEDYTIVDIRSKNEVASEKIFEDALSFPLNELRDNAGKIPTNKPIVVHCAAGFRSAAGSSILENKFKNTRVYDLSDAIEKFK